MYNGGKNAGGAYQTIINQIPPHQTYIELCLGSGAVIRNKKPANKNIALDMDKTLVHKFDFPETMTFLNHSCIDFLTDGDYHYCKDTFIYADPPYLFDTRKSKRPLYKYEFTTDQHVQLLELLKNSTAMVAISCYESNLYNKMLKKWRKVIYYQTDRRGNKREELLFCNYPKPQKLHDYRYLGTDLTDRQRIKRKINRHVQKLRSLPILERQAILNATNCLI